MTVKPNLVFLTVPLDQLIALTVTIQIFIDHLMIQAQDIGADADRVVVVADKADVVEVMVVVADAEAEIVADAVALGVAADKV